VAGETGATGATGATGEAGATGATGAGLTDVLKVSAAGTPATVLGAEFAAVHGVGSGVYKLSTGGGPNLTTCAIMASANAEEGPPFTAQATATGEHAIVVSTYESGTAKDSAFSLTITC
jgi:hypothetical protein